MKCGDFEPDALAPAGRDAGFDADLDAAFDTAFDAAVLALFTFERGASADAPAPLALLARASSGDLRGGAAKVVMA